MAFRGNESPMDFEWQGHHGPVDPTSPFHLAMENAKKRSHSQFESPNKTTLPSLRAPNGKPYFFSNAPTEPQPSPFRAPSFTTPHKSIDIDFSSGPESSPVEQTENEDTPDGKPLPPLPYEFSSKPAKRNSLFGMYGRFAPISSSGRGEIKKPSSDAMVKRIQKKRRQGQKFSLTQQIAKARRDSEESSDDDEIVISPRKLRHQPVQEVGWMTGLFTFIHTYPDAPSLIAKYLWLFVNTMIGCGLLYILWTFWATIKADVDRASDEAMQEILSEMAACSKNYIENGCAADRRVPALETVCSNWELCMNRDPQAVKRARLSAHTFAEIFNGFIEPISWKAFTFTLVFFVTALFVNNGSYMWYKKSHEHDQYRHSSQQFMHPAQQAAQMGQFAATPGLPYNQQHNLGWHGDESLYGHQRQLEYSKSPSKEYRSRSRSPEKKKQYI